MLTTMNSDIYCKFAKFMFFAFSFFAACVFVVTKITSKDTNPRYPSSNHLIVRVFGLMSNMS